MQGIDLYNTPEWEAVREHVWHREKGLCYLCKAPGLDCHHLSYKYGFNNPEWVILVCRPCHRVWQGRSPIHLPDTNPFKPALERIAEIKRCLRGLIFTKNGIVADPRCSLESDCESDTNISVTEFESQIA